MVAVGPTQRLRRELVTEPIVRDLAAALDERLAAAEEAIDRNGRLTNAVGDRAANAPMRAGAREHGSKLSL